MDLCKESKNLTLKKDTTWATGELYTISNGIFIFLFTSDVIFEAYRCGLHKQNSSVGWFTDDENNDF